VSSPKGVLLVLAIVLTSLASCQKQNITSGQENNSGLRLEPRLTDEEDLSVPFEIVSLNKTASSGSAQSYDCTYSSRGRTARFQLLLQQPRSLPEEKTMGVGDGKFVAVQGSDNSTLLEDLKKALDAKQLPKNSRRIRELPFAFVVLGSAQNRDAAGSFSSQPHGDWIAMKIFLPKDGDDGEVFLNLNPVLGKGEFSIKDSDYGDYVVTELAKVL
jgi:hypothetical protein